MANIFSRIGSAIRKAFSKVKSIFTNKELQEEVLDVVDVIAGLATYAYPAAQRVAAMTPTHADDIVLMAMAELGMKVSDIFDIDDEIVRHGRLLQLAATVAKRELQEALNAAGELKIGKYIIKAVDVITNDALRAAVSLAYTTLIKKLAIKG